MSSSNLRASATITLRTLQEPDGSWSAHMLITGLDTEHRANGAVEHMRTLFCGAEIKLSDAAAAPQGGDTGAPS